MSDVEHGSVEAHERLVKACLEELALMGFAAWENPRRAVQVNGRWVSLTKSGRGDIQVILPRVFGVTLVGLHGEIECKTGQSGQSSKQRGHMRMVRNSGGVYLVIRGREELRTELAKLGFSPRVA
ncbi:hypothetical protein R5W24_000504 [Gemmata sp. JC717]|uniref:hypothetical protein n=1 Tax=Gemmata algarum TaxID=2975278 RepID=UPI0021BB35AD|nr:hypothetical protein [Gemmata algarum]MDY3551428.1 hypothetical protein [Gemmata algarum]